MTNLVYLQAIKEIEKNGPLADFVGPQPEDRIKRAEDALGLRFPEDYRDFVLRFGCGNFGSEEIYGVLTDDFAHSGVPDAVWMTLDERRRCGLRTDLLVIYVTGEGFFHALTCANGTAAVVEWMPGRSDRMSSLRQVASGFGEFLLGRVEQVLRHN